MERAAACEHFLGIDVVGPADGGATVGHAPCILAHQQGYVLMLVQQYRDLFNFHGNFRKYDTPMDDQTAAAIGTGADYGTEVGKGQRISIKAIAS